MKKYLLPVLFFSCFIAVGQQTGNMLKKAHFTCSYYGEEIDGKVRAFNTSDSAYAIIQSIVDIVGLKPNFEIRKAAIPNAAAVTYDGKRYVLYNSRFINQLNKEAGNSWAAVSILAHEIGHHLNGHTLASSGSRPDIELEADEFSGFVLRKMGATLSEAQAAMRIASSIKASHTHPGKADRLLAIANGWNQAHAQMAGRIIPPKTNTQIEVPATVKKPSEKEPTILADKYISYDVYFDSDPQAEYFVTIRNNLVKVEAGKVYLAGVMAKSNRKNYPAMFYDKVYNYLYITKDLDIVNGAGKKVGTMKGR